jgi:hypothetical protein
MDFNIEGNQAVSGPVAEVESARVEETPLLALKNRRTEIVNDLFVDIKVPRWESPEIYVRFKPVSNTRLNATINRYQKDAKNGQDWSFLANAQMLIDSCVGIYAIVDGNEDVKLSLREGDPYGKWTKFDTDLAAALGIQANRATDSVIGLYLTEGDLIDTANKLFRWSNIANGEADETF